MTPDHESVRWACFLGANTARRLASEWKIPRSYAGTLLCSAYRARRLQRLQRGLYRAIPPQEAS